MPFLDASIKKTLSYFSLFRYPLTKEELFAYLWQPPKIGLEEFLSAVGQNNWQEKFGYFAVSNDFFTENRRTSLLFCEKKMKIAQRAAKLLRSVPFLRAIFVCNSVAGGLARTESDIDFFIITAPKRIWLVRFFTNLILRFWRLRTYGKKQKDKICLSFFVDENNLNLWPLRAGDEDIHFVYWIHQMIPLFDQNDFYQRFITANKWSEEFIPNVSFLSSSGYLGSIKDTSLASFWRKIWQTVWQGHYGDVLEKQAKEIQLLHLKMARKETRSHPDNSIVVTDSVLKFHENDSRKKIFEEWKKNIVN